MLPPGAIFELKIHQNAFAAGTSLRTSLGELYSAPQTSFQGRPWGNGGEGRNREGRAEGKERKKREGKGIVLLLPFYTLTSIYSTTVAYYRGIQCLENTYFTFFLIQKTWIFTFFLLCCMRFLEQWRRLSTIFDSTVWLVTPCSTVQDLHFCVWTLFNAKCGGLDQNKKKVRAWFRTVTNFPVLNQTDFQSLVTYNQKHDYVFGQGTSEPNRRAGYFGYSQDGGARGT